MKDRQFIQYIIFTARQSSPLRGDWVSKDKAETESNFYQLLMLRANEDVSIIDCLQKKKLKYTAPDIQNEMLEVR